VDQPGAVGGERDIGDHGVTIGGGCVDGAAGAIALALAHKKESPAARRVSSSAASRASSTTRESFRARHRQSAVTTRERRTR
jgi:hypothetical protein